MTNLAATWQTYQIGSRRMWIETMFRDWQSGGFELGKTGITDHERFARVIIVVCLVYLWFVSIGRAVAKSVLVGHVLTSAADRAIGRYDARRFVAMLPSCRSLRVHTIHTPDY